MLIVAFITTLLLGALIMFMALREYSPFSIRLTFAQMKVLRDVGRERERQDSIWGVQDHPISTIAQRQDCLLKVGPAKATCDQNARDGTLTWYDIFREEFMEAFSETDRERQYIELIQASAVLAAAAERIKRLGGNGVD